MPLVSPFHKATCPFCFRTFHISEAPCRVTSPSTQSQPDEHIAKFLQIPPPDLDPVEKPPRGFWRRLGRRFFIPKIKDEELETRRRICPYCHLPLPPAMANGQLASHTIAIVGSRSSGKSNFFGVLIRALEERYKREVDFGMFGQETFSVEYLDRISSEVLFMRRYGSLFSERDRRAVPASAAAAQNPDIRIPLIYRLELKKRPLDYLLHPLSQSHPVDLVVFDVAGEDVVNLSAMQQFWRYVLRAAGIMFLIDPFGYESIRDKLPSDVYERIAKEQDEINVPPAHAVSATLNHFAQAGRLGPGRKLKIPAAFVLTKCDMLEGILPKNSEIFRDPVHRSGFNVNDCHQASNAVAHVLTENGCDGLLATAETSFATQSFFGVSALGALPDEELRLKDLQPRRVADPLFWILWKLGRLRAMREGA